jgi:hypothetical protein
MRKSFTFDSVCDVLDKKAEHWRPRVKESIGALDAARKDMLPYAAEGMRLFALSTGDQDALINAQLECARYPLPA